MLRKVKKKYTILLQREHVCVLKTMLPDEEMSEFLSRMYNT